MSGNTKPKIYWDSCIFLAWIQGEGPPKRKLGDMEGIESIVKLLSRGELLIITSVVTHAEVLASKMGAKAKKLYEDIFQRSDVSEIAVDHQIALLASEIRDFYINAKDKLPADQRRNAMTVDTPDALHLATAILYEADEFQTFDGDDGGRPNGLLRLGEKVATHDLKIRKPVDHEHALLIGVPALVLTNTPAAAPIAAPPGGAGPTNPPLALTPATAISQTHPPAAKI